MMLFQGFRRLTIVATLGVALSACGGAHMSTYTPVNEQTKFSADSLFSAARDAAEQLKLQPRTADQQSHSLDTREKEVATSSIPRLSYKYSFHIETSGGLLAITAACSKNSATSEHTFAECGDDRPERVVQELAALKKRTLELAPRVEANKPDWGNFGKPEQPEEGVDAADSKAADKSGDKAESDQNDKKPGDKADKKSDDKSDKSEKKSDDKSDKSEKKSDEKSGKSEKKSDEKKAGDKSGKKASGKSDDEKTSEKAARPDKKSGDKSDK